MQIKDLAIGDGFVYLMEGSTKVKFYALCHNYESGIMILILLTKLRLSIETNK